MSLWSGLKVKNKILLGHIHGLFGVNGWVKVFSHTRPRHQILSYQKWFLGEDFEQEFIVTSGRSHNEGIIAKIEGVDDRDQAILLLEKKIWINEKELPDLSPNEFYWYQLIGLQVFDTGNKRIGEIIRLFETGANDVMVVRADDNREHLVPYVIDRVIKQVNLDRNTIIVDWDIDY